MIDPVFIVLASSMAAMLISSIGVLPLLGRERLPQAWLGWSNAAAAGTMLGAAYLLAAVGIRRSPLALGAGALAGIAFVWWSHLVSGTDELDLNVQGSTRAGYGSDVVLVSSLHSAAEGLAIGAAMSADLTLGLWVAVAIALHNVPEATLLAAVIHGRGDSKGRALLMAVVSDAPIVPMAVSTYAIGAAAPAVVPVALGCASGALIYLVTVDLLPESYRQAGARSIALVALLSMGLVVALREMVQ